MYDKIESERLFYIKLNQQELRIEENIHLRDATTNDGNVTDIGRMVILPATYISSAGHMHEYAQDAMTYVRSYGAQTHLSHSSAIQHGLKLMKNFSTVDHQRIDMI
ncbi:hypothetical protein AVEN_186285-1 [Araneus ventricosus]|uniref:Helitron helicase-like domain-containing protein n=1 Tax=Araneus ventricosus TaxID=182803 RepID=A0A4Y2THA2_ARAVE|nr:hypothetical protein AVEN_73606-1 [Araneus ventricosus]GBN98491.1 hypothetical protein AVEN_186285-1 [Araneus ventricosus]